jgi:hypothetical protein
VPLLHSVALDGWRPGDVMAPTAGQAVHLFSPEDAAELRAAAVEALLHQAHMADKGVTCHKVEQQGAEEQEQQQHNAWAVVAGADLDGVVPGWRGAGQLERVLSEALDALFRRCHHVAQVRCHAHMSAALWMWDVIGKVIV